MRADGRKPVGPLFFQGFSGHGVVPGQHFNRGNDLPVDQDCCNKSSR